MKRLWIGLLALLLSLTMCGCDLQEIMGVFEQAPEKEVLEATPEEEILSSVEMSLTLLENGYAYDCLSSKQQKNYEALVEKLYERRGQDTKVDDRFGLEITLPRPLDSEEDMKELLDAVMDDHPEFFYLRSQYGWIIEGDSYTKARFFYLWDAEERAQKAEEFEEAVDVLLEQAEGLTPLEQEYVFHDALIERCEYNEEAANESDEDPDTYHRANSAYAALCDGAPICGGYARAFQLLLSRVGIPCTPLVNEDHMWTMVWLGDEVYHVDVTWDDPLEEREQWIYFNVTDEEIRATRDYPEQTRPVPEATDTMYNFYVMNGWHFAYVDEEALSDCIRRQIEDGADVIELRFDEDAFEEASEYLLEENGFYQVVYALEDDELRDAWLTSLYCSKNEGHCITLV